MIRLLRGYYDKESGVFKSIVDDTYEILPLPGLEATSVLTDQILAKLPFISGMVTYYKPLI